MAKSNQKPKERSNESEIITVGLIGRKSPNKNLLNTLSQI